jgi:hypothetical protein
MSKETQEKIKSVCREIEAFLIEKNKSYGDSATKPLQIFSKSNAEERIRSRIDDKLSRLFKGSGYEGDDDVKDLIGYLILLRCLHTK